MYLDNVEILSLSIIENLSINKCLHTKNGLIRVLSIRADNVNGLSNLDYEHNLWIYSVYMRVL